MTMRGVAFWSIDTLSGSKVRKEVKTVRQLNARDSLAALQRRKLLKNQLSYVTAHVPYYRKYQGVDSLEEFPVLDKEMIRNKRTEMISDGVDPEKCHETSTSGSTGTPFRVLHSFEKRRRVNAEAIYSGAVIGAASLVTKPVPESVVVTGVPGKWK